MTDAQIRARLRRDAEVKPADEAFWATAGSPRRGRQMLVHSSSGGRGGNDMKTDVVATRASYLDLALVEGLPLATLDKRLRAAASRAGVELFLPAEA